MVVNGPQPDWSVKDVFTTGEAAELCRVSQQTIIRCFDSGRLTGFKVPGSRFRRIPRDELIRFMRANNIPTEVIESAPVIRIMVACPDRGLQNAVKSAIEADTSIDGRCQVLATADALEAGIMAASCSPSVIVIGDMGGSTLQAAVHHLVALAHAPRVLCVPGTANENDASALLAAGAAHVIAADRQDQITAALAAMVRAKLSENGK
jgi:excisionase family DNA binding protein